MKIGFLYFLFFLFSISLYSQIGNAPIVSASGRQVFCPGSSINIVTNFSITDADDTTIDAFFIQISSGYQQNFDRLILSGNHPNINTDWDSKDGKLTFSSVLPGREMLLTDLENAVKDIQFTSTSTSLSIEKTFSLTADEANYLPSTNNFYEFISAPGIDWASAKIAAENKTFYGRKGYLTTLTSQEEADFAGKQAQGAGWIGGSDLETEGVWKWVTGPETGTVFWNGGTTGTSPNYSNWNRSEPNNQDGEEHYAHITDPNVPNVIVGSWNDLPLFGSDGLYAPKGYIVEYGTPSDPPLNIAASTSIYIPQITNTTGATICESGIATISATPSEGTVLWYDSPIGGNFLASGNNFTTPVLTTNKIYYATVSVNNCLTVNRTQIEVIVIQRPTIKSITEETICSGSAVLSATASDGDVYWYESLSSTTPIFIGDAYRTPNLNSTKAYYVEANNANCVSTSRTEVKAILDNTIPQFDLTQTNYVLCKDIGNVTIETENPQGNYRYVWTKNNAIIPGDLSSLEVKESGEYNVKAFSSSGCESMLQTITVNDSEKATVTNDDVIIIDDASNNSIEVINPNLGIGDYEFTLDDKFGTYKDIGFFDNIEIGIHTLYIKDKNGCEITPYSFTILAFPKFFTPNGDGNNEVWKIKGFDNSLYTTSDIYIYNRFGILIHKISPTEEGWNGTYQGKVLPSNTYWYNAILIDINGRKIEKVGSFSLIRN